MYRVQGTSLIELMIALLLGLLIISALLYAYQVAVHYARRQQSWAYVYQQQGMVEAQLRSAFSYSVFSPDCSGVLPNIDNSHLGLGVSPSIKERLRFPVNIYPVSVHAGAISAKDPVVANLNRVLPSRPKKLMRLIVGNDILSLTELKARALRQQGSHYIIDRQEGRMNSAEFTVLLTDCAASYVAKVSRHPAGYYFDDEDTAKMVRIFRDTTKLMAYEIISSLVYIHVERGRPHLIHDYLDGSNFFKAENVLVFRLWHYDPIQGWQRLNNELHRMHFDVLGVQLVIQTAQGTGDKQVSLEAPHIFGRDVGAAITLVAARHVNLNTFFIMRLYNY